MKALFFLITPKSVKSKKSKLFRHIVGFNELEWNEPLETMALTGRVMCVKLKDYKPFPS